MTSSGSMACLKEGGGMASKERHGDSGMLPALGTRTSGVERPLGLVRQTGDLSNDVLCGGVAPGNQTNSGKHTSAPC